MSSPVISQLTEQAQPTAPNPRVLVSGQPTVTITGPAGFAISMDGYRLRYVGP